MNYQKHKSGMDGVDEHQAVVLQTEAVLSDKKGTLSLDKYGFVTFCDNNGDKVIHYIGGETLPVVTNNTIFFLKDDQHYYQLNSDTDVECWLDYSKKAIKADLITRIRSFFYGYKLIMYLNKIQVAKRIILPIVALGMIALCVLNVFWIILPAIIIPELIAANKMNKADEAICFNKSLKDAFLKTIGFILLFIADILKESSESSSNTSKESNSTNSAALDQYKRSAYHHAIYESSGNTYEASRTKAEMDGYMADIISSDNDTIYLRNDIKREAKFEAIYTAAGNNYEAARSKARKESLMAELIAKSK